MVNYEFSDDIGISMVQQAQATYHVSKQGHGQIIGRIRQELLQLDEVEAS